MSEGNKSGKPTLAERMANLYRRRPKTATLLAAGPLALGLVGCSSPDEPPKPENTVNTQAAGSNKLGDGEKAPQVDDPCASTEQEDGEVSQVGYDDRADDEATHGGESLAQAIENVGEANCRIGELNMFIPAPDNPEAIAALAQTDRFVPTEEQRERLVAQAIEPLPFVGEADVTSIIKKAEDGINVMLSAASEKEAAAILVNLFGNPDSRSEGTQQRVERLMEMRSALQQAYGATAGWSDDDFYYVRGNKFGDVDSNKKVDMTFRYVLEEQAKGQEQNGIYATSPHMTNIWFILGDSSVPEGDYVKPYHGSEESTIWITVVPGSEGSNLIWESGPAPSELLDGSAR